MKLVRLQSDNAITESQFTNNLAIAVQLEENARVALKTISLEFEQPEITIDSTNDSISYGVGGTINRTIKIEHGNYYNIELMREIQRKLNASLQSEDESNNPLKLEIGSEWLCEAVLDTNQRYRAEIAYQVGDIDDSITDADVVGNMQYDTGEFTKAPDTDDNTYNAYLQTDLFMCFGGWLGTIQLNKQSPTQTEDIKDSDWILSISYQEVVEKTDKDDIIADSPVCIMRNTEGNYSYKKDGYMVATNPPVQIEDEDFVSIAKVLNNGKTYVVYIIQKGTQTLTFIGDEIILSDAVEIGIQPFYYTLKVGNDTGKIMYSNLKYTPSAASIQVSPGVFVVKKASQAITIIKNINLDAVARDVILRFDTRQLQYLLGYLNSQYKKNGVEITFNGENEMEDGVFKNDLIVEIPELNLNTYDQTFKQKRNIIMVIPSGDLKNAITSRGIQGYELSYTDIYPTFVSLKNKQTTLTYPQLTVRVIANKQLLKVNGKMSCLLLFKDAEDL
jgi:hypothetical protein